MNTMVGLRSGGVRFCLALSIAVTLAFAAEPAGACGCGVYLPLDGEAGGSEEHVLIRWDGQTEDIVMTLGVLGSSSEAAVIFLVPARATVQIADGKVFDALRELIRPVDKNVYQMIPMLGASAPPPSAVTLLSRQTIGPFDVSTLAATDASALGDWLSANGYNLPPEIAGVLESYVALNWYYIAVRLSLGTGSDGLTGALDPLWITFPYDQIVYSMRPSALARNNLTVFMYVLVEHRVHKPVSFGFESVQYADWLDPADLAPDSPLAPFVPRKLFLTKIVEQINDPKTIQDDYVFAFAATDDIYHAVRYHDIFDIAGIPLCFLIPGGLILLAPAGVLLIRSSLRRKRLARSEP